MTERNAVRFNEIEIVYWRGDDGFTVLGEAYFREDDYCAPIVNGEFAHPYSGLRYKLHVPSRFGQNKEAILDVLKWSNFGRAVPIRCPAESR